MVMKYDTWFNICSRPSRDRFDEKDAERESVLGRSEVRYPSRSRATMLYEKYRNGANRQNASKIAAMGYGELAFLDFMLYVRLLIHSKASRSISA